MREERKGNVLYVQMFHNFSMEWNGKKIVGGKTRESQLLHLLQMILHFREAGVTKEEIQTVIFGERELENANHALRSVVYNARKKLQAAGLPPGVSYIERREGRFCWNKAVPVVEDASEMERLFTAAEAEEDSHEKLRLYLDACYSYTGDFLGTGNSVLWMAQEARKYHYLFCDSMEKAVKLLRQESAYEKMEKLGRHASQSDPLADWETVTMEALNATGQYREAGQLYDETVELYQRELGSSPSPKLNRMMKLMEGQLQHSYALLGQIQAGLAQGEEGGSGGYVCSYPVFMGIYQMVQRMMGRNGHSAFLMLCTIVDSRGKPLKDGVKMEGLSWKLEESIRLAVRRSDVIHRYNKGQYLVLLINTTRENCDVVQRRISQNFMVNRQRISVEYHVNGVEFEQEHIPVMPEKGED